MGVEDTAAWKGGPYTWRIRSEIQQMLWEDGDSLIEIRNEAGLSGGIDELVAAHANLHLEQMELDHWSMTIDAGGKSLNLDFRIEGGRLTVNLSEHR